MIKINEMAILDPNRETEIVLLGKVRKLLKTNKGVSNKITYLLKKDAYINSPEVNFQAFERLSKEWNQDAQKLVKQIIKPISKAELEYVDTHELEIIADAIERRKYEARGYTQEEIDTVEEAGRKALVARAKAINEGLEIEALEEDEDFQETNTDQDLNTGKRNISED